MKYPVFDNVLQSVPVFFASESSLGGGLSFQTKSRDFLFGIEEEVFK